MRISEVCEPYEMVGPVQRDGEEVLFQRRRLQTVEVDEVARAVEGHVLVSHAPLAGGQRHLF